MIHSHVAYGEGVITDRNSLDDLLTIAGRSIVEDFESFNVQDNNNTSLDNQNGIGVGLILDSKSIFWNKNGSNSLEGPDLILEGVSFGGNPNDATGYTEEQGIDGKCYKGYWFLEWVGKGYYGQSSRKIATSYHPSIAISFDKPRFAVGFDLSSYSGFPMNAIVSVFNSKNNLIYTSPLLNLATQDPFFWGYSTATADIKTVVIKGTVYRYPEGYEYVADWSPLLDNVAFNNVVPEPVSTILFGLGGGALTLFRKKRLQNLINKH